MNSIFSTLSICAVLTCIILHPVPAVAYDAPWDGGHTTTTPDESPTPRPPGEGNQGGGGDPVNLKAGNFGWSAVDILIPGLGQPLYIHRSYNSQDRYVGPFGYGWHFYPFMYSIEVAAGESKEVVVKRGDGIRKIFLDNGDSTYTPKDGSRRHTLTRNQDGYYLSDYDNVTYHFDTDSVLRTVSDLNGNTFTYGYDALGRIVSLTDSAARQLLLTYNANNRIVSASDFNGRTINYTYDENDNLTGVINALGQKTVYTYDAAHLLLSVTDPAGNTLIANSYDSLHRVVSQGYVGQTLSFIYNSTYTRVNNRRNFDFDIYLNETGNPAEVRAPSGNNYQLEFGSDMQLTAMSDSQGRIQVAYDTLGRIRSLISPDSAISTFTYLDDTSLLSSVTDELGRTTAYGYDAKYNLTAITNPLSEVTEYQYDGNGKLTKAVYADGATTDLVYSATGYLTLLKDTIGTSIYSASFQYDPVGNVTQVTRFDGSTVSNEYNVLNQLLRVTDNGYSPARITEYEYDLGGDMHVVRQDGHEKTLEYNHNLVSSITYPDGTQTLYGYNGNDRISQVTYSQGSALYEFNNVERITKATHPDANEFIFGWGNDNLTEITGPGTDLTLQYDNNRRLLGFTDNTRGKSVYFGYNSSGQRTQMVHSGGQISSYSYDVLGRLYNVADNLGTVTAISPPAKSKTVPTFNKIISAAQHNKNNWLIALLSAKGPDGAVSKNGFQYPGTDFWHNSYSANKRWYFSLMSGLSSNRLNMNVRTPMDIMR